MIVFYIVFSYLYMLGVRSVTKIPDWNFLLAPIFLPIILGQQMTQK